MASFAEPEGEKKKNVGSVMQKGRGCAKSSYGAVHDCRRRKEKRRRGVSC